MCKIANTITKDFIPVLQDSKKIYRIEISKIENNLWVSKSIKIKAKERQSRREEKEKEKEYVKRSRNRKTREMSSGGARMKVSI